MCYVGGGGSRGCLVLLHSVLAVILIPISYLSVFNVPMKISKQLDGLMRRLLRRRVGVGEGRGTVLVTWDVICRPLHSGVLGVLHKQSMNLALRTRCC